MQIDEEQAKNIAKTLLERDHAIKGVSAVLEGNTWIVLVDDSNQQIEVSVDADYGRVLGYIFLKDRK